MSMLEWNDMVENRPQLVELLKEILSEKFPKKNKLQKNKITKNKPQKNKFRKPKKLRENELDPEYETAYEEGANAYFDGVPKNNNPYRKTNYRQQISWATGWDDGWEVARNSP